MAKSDTHPTYYPSCKVYHNGQVVMTVGATVPELHVEVWSGSHPFFTGKQTFIDSAGRVEKFTKKYSGNYFAKPEAKKADAKPEAKPAVLGTDKVQAPKA